MLDIRYIRENPEIIKKGIKDKQLEGTVDIDKILSLDQQVRDLTLECEKLRKARNDISEEISKAKPDERVSLLTDASNIKSGLELVEQKLILAKTELDKLLIWVPNPPAPDVPYGEGEDDNVVVKTYGEAPRFSFTPKDHVELGTITNILDLERGAKIGGFRGYFLKNAGVLLEQAILRFALDTMIENGFDIYTVPWMVRPDFFFGTAYFPWGEEDHYRVQDGLALIGTAEVSLTSYYAGETLKEEDLPIKLAGISPCYRREIGSHGRDTKGVIRVHQFNKVEQVVLVPADEKISVEWHEKMKEISEDIVKKLGLHYHVLLMCTGDMGAPHRKKYDIECWFPSQNKFRETHSDSYFLDFQSRRLNIRYKTKDGETKYVHTLNNTVAATPRLLACIIENYQQEDGSITVPEVLRKYMNGIEVIPVGGLL